MTHLTMEQLLALDEPGLEPGTAQARAHLQDCAACRAEYERLRQRQARLRALPTLRPARDQWPAVARRVAAERRRRLVQRAVAAISAVAALLLLAVALRSARPAHDVEGLAAEAQITELMERSRALEAAIGALEHGTAVAFSSGMGAANAVMDLQPMGAVVVAPSAAYTGVAVRLRELDAIGRIRLRIVEADDTAAVTAACEGATVASWAAWRWMASTTFGCEWPMLVLTSWLEKSR